MTSHRDLNHSSHAFTRQEARTFAAEVSRGDEPRWLTVPWELLTEIQLTQGRLDAYVRSYIALREEAAKCRSVKDQLAEVKRERSRINDQWFLNNLNAQVNALGDLPSALGNVRRVHAEELDPMLRKHEEELQKAFDAMELVTNPSQDADVMTAVDTVFRAMTDMSRAIDRSSDNCRRWADDYLYKLRVAIEKVFAIENGRRIPFLEPPSGSREGHWPDEGAVRGSERAAHSGDATATHQMPKTHR